MLNSVQTCCQKMKHMLYNTRKHIPGPNFNAAASSSSIWGLCRNLVVIAVQNERVLFVLCCAKALEFNKTKQPF